MRDCGHRLKELRFLVPLTSWISQAQFQMRPSGIEPDLPRWQRDVLTDILWPRTTSSFRIFIKLFS